MKKKENYYSPEIELIRLDNDISLQLASDADPMGEPIDWEVSATKDYFSNDPMNDQLA
jgi:hypothetical protein